MSSMVEHGNIITMHASTACMHALDQEKAKEEVSWLVRMSRVGVACVVLIDATFLGLSSI